MTAAQWIETLGLEPHPEGGFYKETYRASRLLGGRTPVSTAIHFLLRRQDYSAFHRIASDELWHLYAVTPLTRLRVWRLTPQGHLGTFLLGTEPARNESFQDWVPAGDWFAAEVETLHGAPDEAYALVGCTVSPGFQYSEFELADGARLARDFPQEAELIRRLSRAPSA